MESTQGPSNLEESERMLAPLDEQPTPAQRTQDVTASHQEPEATDRVRDGFIMIDIDDNLKHNKHRLTFYSQMEKILVQQVEKCDYWKKYFEEQNNTTMANKFEAYSVNTLKNYDLLKVSLINNDVLPKYRYEHVSFNCLPVNVDVPEKVVQLVVKSMNLPIEEGASTYIVAEFVYPHPKEETLMSSLIRKAQYVNIDPKNIVSCCTGAINSKQIDLVHSTDEVQFNNPDCKHMLYCRPINLHIDKPKSRSLRRKFKPVKLTLYEKRKFPSFDKRLGSAQFRIDCINDEVTMLSRQYLMDGLKQTDGVLDIKIRVREALANRSVRAHEEKLLSLT